VLTALPGAQAIQASHALEYMIPSGCTQLPSSMVVRMGRTRFEHYEDFSKHPIDLSRPVFEKEPATTSGTKAPEGTDLFRLRSDHDLLQFMQQLFAISQRKTYIFRR